MRRRCSSAWSRSSPTTCGDSGQSDRCACCYSSLIILPARRAPSCCCSSRTATVRRTGSSATSRSACRCVTFAVTLVLWAGFDARQRRTVPVRRARVVDSRVRHRVLRRHRRPQPDAAGADRLPDADCAAVVVGEHREEGQGVLDLHAAARGGDDRRVLRRSTSSCSTCSGTSS